MWILLLSLHLVKLLPLIYVFSSGRDEFLQFVTLQ
jgi:hypothetical protein